MERESSAPVWELYTLEKACEKYIKEQFASDAGINDLIFRFTTVWEKDPVRYAQPIAMFLAVRAWMEAVWGIYAAYKFQGVAPDFSSLPAKPCGYFEIIAAEAVA